MTGNQLALTFPGGRTVAETDISEGYVFNFADEDLATIVNTVFPVIMVIAGLVLFAMIVSGGFTIFLSSGEPEKMKQGQSKITNGLIGLLIIFAAYWIVQLIEFSLGVNLLGTP
jgi:hypothetical protein